MTVTSGPHSVSKGDLATGVNAQSGDVVEISTTGVVGFSSLGLNFNADGGDVWSNAFYLPAPDLKLFSLIVRFGSGRWYQGGVAATINVPAGESGEVILRTNDDDLSLWDNSGAWSATLTITTPDPPVQTPGPTAPTLKVLAIELVQAIQRSDNSVPLVLGKRTVARVFIDSGLRNGEDVGAGPNLWPGVTGTLTVTDAATQAVLATVDPLENWQTDPFNVVTSLGKTLTARPIDTVKRGQFDHSLNFDLPPAALQSPSVDILVEVNAPTSPTPAAGATDSLSVHAEFTSRAGRTLLPILINVTNRPDMSRPTEASFNSSVMGALARLPLPEDGFVVCPAQLWDAELSPLSRDSWKQLLCQIETANLVGIQPVGAIRCGFLPELRLDHIVGIAELGYPALVCYENLPATFAHEFGHTLGLRHSPCTGKEDDIDPRGFPGHIDDIGLNVGTAHGTRPDVPGLQRAELMSWCDNGHWGWPCVKVYEILFNEFHP